MKSGAGLSDKPGEYPYIVSHNLIKAHAKSYRLYYEKYHEEQQGQVGITLNGGFSVPVTNSTEDAEAAERGMQFGFGWYAHAIFKDGDYPPIMREKIDAKSQEQGFPESRLPSFTEEEKAMIVNSSDFFGLNYYTGGLTGHRISDINDVSYFADSDTYGATDESWYRAASSWLYVTPWTLRLALGWIKNEYGNPAIYITENGFSDMAGNLDDLQRVFYYKYYINEVLKAIVEDDVDVRMYTAWSLMDNFEWARGYLEKFGMHRVDFTDPQRPRTPKTSALLYKQIIADNGFVENPNCILDH